MERRLSYMGFPCTWDKTCMAVEGVCTGVLSILSVVGLNASWISISRVLGLVFIQA
jgi:hypothetical protein